MLLEVVKNEIQNEFPSLVFSLNEKEHVLMIEGPNQEVGNIEIEDDLDELIVVVGNFTHWHAACYDETLSKEEKQKQIASEVTEFLSDLFTDKIVMWGSHKNGGGFYYPEFNENEQDAPLEPNEVNKYVWSGKKIS